MKRINRLYIATILAIAAITAEAENKIIFRYTGTDQDSIVYRIPAIASLPDNRLIAVADYRYCGYDIGNGRIDLHQSVSDDGGKTWSRPALLTDKNGTPVSKGDGQGTVETSLQHPDCGYGDPAIVADRETGEILMLAVCGRTPFFKARRDNPNQVARWRSNDGGKSWTERDTITSEIHGLFDGRRGDRLCAPGGCIDAMFFGSGRIMQSRHIKAGSHYRIYSAISGRHVADKTDTDSVGTYIANWVLYSDDFGQNWHILGHADTPPVAIGGDEPKVEELPDGSVVISARSSINYGRNFNIFRYSDTAKATGSWEAAPVLSDFGGVNPNPCNGEILIIPVKDNKNPGNKNAWVALQSMTLSKKREDVGIKWKPLLSPADYADAVAMAQGWGDIDTQTLKLTDLPSGYSTMVQMPDGKIAFLFEEATYDGKEYSIVYVGLALEEITGGRFSARL